VNSYRVEVAIFAIALTVFGLVALALVWSGDWAYAALANATGNTSATFVVPPERRELCGPAMVMDLMRLLELHRAWATYVVGASEVAVGPGCSLFTADEYAHMADVRSVFRGAEAVALLALVVAAFRVVRARRRGDALRLVRAGGLISAAIVAVIGVVAVFAFDPLFLLFHEVFFPQGNFLFDPATSNLLRLYPEWYWQGITAGVGVSFIAAALGMAAVSHIALRRASNTYTRAA
jgi:integral membrane protein (TIGR01906 family)